MRPLPNGRNGRGGDGRFTLGNRGGPGNPYGRQTARLRQLIREAVTDGDLRAIVRSLVDAARGGDLLAAREILNRLVGRPGDGKETDWLARRDADEERERRQPVDLDGFGVDGGAEIG